MGALWALGWQLLIALIPTLLFILGLFYLVMEWYLKKYVRHSTLLIFTDPNGVQRSKLVRMGGGLTARVKLGNIEGYYIIDPAQRCVQEYPSGLPGFMRESIPVYYFNVLNYAPIAIQGKEDDGEKPPPASINKRFDDEDTTYETEEQAVDISDPDKQIHMPASTLKKIVDDEFLATLIKNMADLIDRERGRSIEPTWILAGVGLSVVVGAVGVWMGWNLTGQIGDLTAALEQANVISSATPVPTPAPTSVIGR